MEIATIEPMDKFRHDNGVNINLHPTPQLARIKKRLAFEKIT